MLVELGHLHLFHFRHRVEDIVENTEPERTSFLGAGSSVNVSFSIIDPLSLLLCNQNFSDLFILTLQPDESDWDDLGGDLYEIPEVLPVQPSYAVPDVPPTNKADEDSKLKALIETPSLDWQQ